MTALEDLITAFRATGADSIVGTKFDHRGSEQMSISLSCGTEAQVHAIAAVIGSSAPKAYTHNNSEDRFVESEIRTPGLTVIVSARIASRKEAA